MSGVDGGHCDSVPVVKAGVSIPGKSVILKIEKQYGINCIVS